jgi:hypothetical protein
VDLLARQHALQREAVDVLHEWRVEETLAVAGPTLVVGSFATGLMVWRDVDVVVDARGLATVGAFDVMRTLLGRSRAARYERDDELDRHYFVLRIPWQEDTEWKLDVSLFLAGIPPDVEAFRDELLARLTDETRLTILALKDAWYENPAYPEVVGGFEIAHAVLNHDVGSLAELDAYLVARGLPARA